MQVHSGMVEAALLLLEQEATGQGMDTETKVKLLNASVASYFEESAATMGVVIDCNGNPYCKLCGKEGWQHLHSTEHQTRLDEMTIGNLLAGPAEGGRRISAGRMNTGIPVDVPLTQETVQQVWGEAFDHLGQRGLIRIISCGGIHVDGQLIPAADIKGVAVKLVSYNGQAKYHSDTKLISDARLPENDDQYNR